MPSDLRNKRLYLSNFTKTEQVFQVEGRGSAKTEGQQRAFCVGNSLWLKDVKGCRWDGQMVKDLEEHAKEFGLIL